MDPTCAELRGPSILNVLGRWPIRLCGCHWLIWVLLSGWIDQVVADLPSMDARVRWEPDPLPVPFKPWSRQLEPRSAGSVVLPAPDLAQVRLEDEQAWESRRKEGRRIGIRREIPARVGPASGSSGKATAGSWQFFPDGRCVWVQSIESEEALALRIRFGGVELPGSVQLFVYAEGNPAEFVGPYTMKDALGREELWTGTLFSSRVVVECQVPAGVPWESVQFEIPEVMHRYVRMPWLSPAQEKSAGSCNLDVTCFPDWEQLSRAVVGLGVVQRSGELFCTACLINDEDPSPGTDFVLTANHCVMDQREADNVEFYWRYRANSCGGVVPSPSQVPRTGGGAEFIAGSLDWVGNDFALLRLRGTPPSGVVYAGWNGAAPQPFEVLTTIHHPRGDFQRLSSGNGIEPQSMYWPVRWFSGVTEPGSSGSPLFNDRQQIIGQLMGGSSSCEQPSGIDIYGRMDHTLRVVGDWLRGEGSPPHNDSFANAEILSGTSGSIRTSNIGGSREPGEPLHAGMPGGRSIWYRWTAPESMPVRFSTQGSEFDTTLAVYRGVLLHQLSLVVANDDTWFGLDSEVTWNAVEGESYWVAVDGVRGGAGLVFMHWNRADGGGIAVHDNFEDAKVLEGERGDAWTYNIGASKEPGEPDHALNEGGASVWFRWVAPQSGAFRFDTEGSDFDTTLGVYIGASVDALVVVARNDDISWEQSIYTSRVHFNAVEGRTYHIAVDGFGISDFVDQGFVLLTWGPAAASVGSAPPNDDFSQAIALNPLGASSGRLTTTNQRATRENSEPLHAGNSGGRSLWYRWTAPDRGLVTFTTLGSDFDTLLGVYTGAILSGLTEVAANDDIDWFQRRSQVTFQTSPGQLYHIAVDGHRTPSQAVREGTVEFSWEFELGAGGNDLFANAQVLTGDRGRVVGENWSARTEPEEPHHALLPPDRTIWYRWQAPSSGRTTWDTLGSTFDTLMAVYTGSSLTSLQEIASNDDINLFLDQWQSRVEFDAVALTTYHIAVGGVDQGFHPGPRGSLVLNWKLVPLPSLDLRVSLTETSQVALELSGTPDQDFILDKSPDLNTWEGVLEGTLDAGGRWVGEIDTDPEDSAFFYRGRQVP